MEQHHVHERHDWHSTTYVRNWIAEDFSSDNQRAPLLLDMLALAPHDVHAPLEVIDIGAGYGLLSQLVLQRFPVARTTLLDFSEPMLQEARIRLEGSVPAPRFVKADLMQPWTAQLGRQFDIAVSAFAIHNLEEPQRVAKSFADVATVLKPGGVFLNYDYFIFSGGLEGHLDMLRAAGFQRVSAHLVDDQIAAMAGFIPNA
jgi:ubiquinone/menaquinone biosynthesis C-methylase UbiE